MDENANRKCVPLISMRIPIRSIQKASSLSLFARSAAQAVTVQFVEELTCLISELVGAIAQSDISAIASVRNILMVTSYVEA